MHTVLDKRRTGIFLSQNEQCHIFAVKVNGISPWAVLITSGSGRQFAFVSACCTNERGVALKKFLQMEGQKVILGSHISAKIQVAFQEFHYKRFWNCPAVVLLFRRESVLADIETTKLRGKLLVATCEIGHLTIFLSLPVCAFNTPFNNLQTQEYTSLGYRSADINFDFYYARYACLQVTNTCTIDIGCRFTYTPFAIRVCPINKRACSRRIAICS